MSANCHSQRNNFDKVYPTVGATPWKHWSGDYETLFFVRMRAMLSRLCLRYLFSCKAFRQSPWDRHNRPHIFAESRCWRVRTQLPAGHAVRSPSPLVTGNLCSKVLFSLYIRVYCSRSSAISFVRTNDRPGHAYPRIPAFEACDVAAEAASDAFLAGSTRVANLGATDVEWVS